MRPHCIVAADSLLVTIPELDCNIVDMGNTVDQNALNLLYYSYLLGKLQGVRPEFMYVVTPGTHFEPVEYRLADYAAYFRLLEGRMKLIRSSSLTATCVHGGASARSVEGAMTICVM